MHFEGMGGPRGRGNLSLKNIIIITIAFIITGEAKGGPKPAARSLTMMPVRERRRAALAARRGPRGRILPLLPQPRTDVAPGCQLGAGDTAQEGSGIKPQAGMERPPAQPSAPRGSHEAASGPGCSARLPREGVRLALQTPHLLRYPFIVFLSFSGVWHPACKGHRAAAFPRWAAAGTGRAITPSHPTQRHTQLLFRGDLYPTSLWAPGKTPPHTPAGQKDKNVHELGWGQHWELPLPPPDLPASPDTC